MVLFVAVMIAIMLAPTTASAFQRDVDYGGTCKQPWRGSWLRHAQVYGSGTTWSDWTPEYMYVGIQLWHDDTYNPNWRIITTAQEYDDSGKHKVSATATISDWGRGLQDMGQS